MNKKLIISIVIALGLFTFTSVFSKSISKPKKEVVLLEKKNTVVYRNVFTGNSVSQLEERLMKLSGTLEPTDVIYLFLDTPGGSVTAGNDLITFIKGLPQEVKTITNTAASMGFHLVQNAGERLILPTGVLMSHRAYMGMEGQMPGEFETRVEWIKNTLVDLEMSTASRMGLTHKVYTDKIFKEYWITGTKAVAEKAADKVVLAKCSSDMNGTYGETIVTIFGNIDVQWYECPLLSAPKSISFGKLEGYSSELEGVKKVITEVLNNVSLINTNSTLRENFFKYVR